MVYLGTSASGRELPVMDGSNNLCGRLISRFHGLSCSWSGRSDLSVNLRESNSICAKLSGDFVVSNIPVHLISSKI